MIYAYIFLVLTMISGACWVIVSVFDKERLSKILCVLMIIFVVIAITLGIVEGNEFVAECKDFCNEWGYDYDSVRDEGEETYCICDTSLERHLIKKTVEVVITG